MSFVFTMDLDCSHQLFPPVVRTTFSHQLLHHVFPPERFGPLPRLRYRIVVHVHIFRIDRPRVEINIYEVSHSSLIALELVKTDEIVIREKCLSYCRLVNHLVNDAAII